MLIWLKALEIVPITKSNIGYLMVCGAVRNVVSKLFSTFIIYLWFIPVVLQLTVSDGCKKKQLFMKSVQVCMSIKRTFSDNNRKQLFDKNQTISLVSCFADNGLSI